jgi:hypothetical protein
MPTRWAGSVQSEVEVYVTVRRIRQYYETTDIEVLIRTVKSETPPGGVGRMIPTEAKAIFTS